MTRMLPPSRRSFLQTSAAAGLTAFAAPAARALGANDTIQIGCIGTGGRCRRLMQTLAQIPSVRLAAVCDIYEPHLDQARKLADPKAFATRKYQEILDRKDIDAVVIGS